jgi:hypothetical protein
MNESMKKPQKKAWESCNVSAGKAEVENLCMNGGV